MKALSLTQPYASLISIGVKGIETRSWSTSYRGSLAIHASKGFSRECKALCFRQPFCSPLIRAGFNTPADLPCGAIVAVARLHGIVRTEDVLPMSQGLLRHEIEFGDYAPGRFAWVLAGVVRLAVPILMKGAFGLWTVPPDVLKQIEALRS